MVHDPLTVARWTAGFGPMMDDGVARARFEELFRRLGPEGEKLSPAEQSELLRLVSTRPLDHAPFPDVVIDVSVEDVTSDATAHARVTATGCTVDGDPEPLGAAAFGSIDRRSWMAFLIGLRARGLSGVWRILAEPSPGLAEAVEFTFPEARLEYVPAGFVPAWLSLATEYRDFQPGLEEFFRPSPEPDDADAENRRS